VERSRETARQSGRPSRGSVEGQEIPTPPVERCGAAREAGSRVLCVRSTGGRRPPQVTWWQPSVTPWQEALPLVYPEGSYGPSQGASSPVPGAHRALPSADCLLHPLRIPTFDEFRLFDLDG
jgi:hypothetical protein